MLSQSDTKRMKNPILSPSKENHTFKIAWWNDQSIWLKKDEEPNYKSLKRKPHLKTALWYAKSIRHKKKEELNSQSLKKNHTLKIASWNAQSITYKKEEANSISLKGKPHLKNCIMECSVNQTQNGRT